jgi:tetratricopeptide (TPR) repeat protein
VRRVVSPPARRRLSAGLHPPRLAADGPADAGRADQAALAEALAEHDIEGRPPRSDERLWGYFHDKQVEFWNRRNRLITLVLVLDQFEEIFTLGHRVASAEAVLDELAALIENSPPANVRAALDDEPEAARHYDFAKEICRVILALREDYLPDFEGLRRRMPSIMENRMRLTRMDGRQARDVILASGRHLVAPGVADKVIAFVAASRTRADGETVVEQDLAGLEIDPALLSIVCSELNNKRVRLGQRQISADLLEGAQQEIVGQFYEASLAGIDPAVRLFIEERLLTAEGYRYSRPLAEALGEPGVTRADIDKLVARRLLRIEEHSGTQRVELTHDLLTEVVQQQRDLRREQRAAAREAEERAEAERQRAERAEAEAARERGEREAQTVLAREAAEREHLARRLVRRTQIALAATVVALMVAVGAGLYAWDQRRLSDTRAAEAALQRQLAEAHSEEAMYIQTLALQAITGNEGKGNSANDLVHKMRDYQVIIERLVATDPADSGRQAELAIIHLWVAVGLKNLGDSTGVLAEFQEYKSITTRLAGTHPENRILQYHIAFGHSGMGDLLRDSGDLPGALAEYRAALAVFARLAEREPPAQTDQKFLGDTHNDIGKILKRQGDLEGAVTEWRASRAILTQIVAGHPDDADWRAKLVDIEKQIADALRD